MLRALHDERAFLVEPTSQALAKGLASLAAAADESLRGAARGCGEPARQGEVFGGGVPAEEVRGLPEARGAGGRVAPAQSAAPTWIRDCVPQSTPWRDIPAR